MGSLPVTELRDLLTAHRAAVLDLVARRGAVNPRVFGSVARGDADTASDIDLLIELPGVRPGAELMAVLALAHELSELLGVKVDVVTNRLLRGGLSRAVQDDATPL